MECAGPAIVVILTLSIPTPVVQGHGDHCPELEGCYEDTPFEGTISQEIVEGIVRYNDSTIKHLCRSWPAVKSCLTRANIMACDEMEEQDEAFAARGLFTHLCGAGLANYVKHNECYQTPSLVSKIQAHLASLNEKNEQLNMEFNRHKISLEQLFKEECRLLHEKYLGPVNKDVDRQCGRQAQMAFNKILLSAMTSLAQEGNCTLQETWGPFSGVSVGQASMLLMVLAAASVLCTLF